MVEEVKLEQPEKKKIGKYTTIRRGNYYVIHYAVFNLNNIVMILIGITLGVIIW